MNDDDLLTTKQAAALLAVSVQRVRQFMASGDLPSIKPGHDRLMRRGDVEKLRARKTTPGPTKGRAAGRDEGEAGE